MSTSDRLAKGQARVRKRALGLVLVAGMALVIAPRARGAGIEHPDIGTIAIGRGGAYAAAPSDGLAMWYNPAGLASQRGLRFTLDSNLAWQGLSFAPLNTTVGPAASNTAGPFLVPAGNVSFGLGPVGPLSGLTFSVGATGPSAIGKENFDPKGAQRYSLISSDYFIAFYSLAAAASFRDWLSAGVTLELVKGTAKFSQAVWSGSGPGVDPTMDAVANIDVASPVIPTATFGVSVRPLPPLALGLSYRPHFDFLAHGSLTTQIPEIQKAALGIEVQGDRTDFFVSFPDVIRFGAQYQFQRRILVEADVVAELWSRLKTIEIRPHDINIVATNLGTQATLRNIIFQKDFHDAVSVRIGGDYMLLPGLLTVRAGYLHETSAIPTSGVSIDFGNWRRDAVSVGGTVRVYRGIDASIAYAHHFLADQHVTDSKVVQIVTPCVTAAGCTDPPAAVVGNGTYKGSLDVLSLSVGLILDDLQRRP